MPHSGGGGSHSGGHRGGHHSSGRSSKPRISNSYYRGSNRYIYYRNRRPHYYYSTKPYNPKEESYITLLISAIWMLISLIVVFAMIKISDSEPLPLNYDSEIIICDTIGIVEDENKLIDSFKDFQDKTGITLALLTLRPEETDYKNAKSVENLALDTYLSLWNDESHWLIYYLGEERDRSDDWCWNLMCGDDCVKIVSRDEEDKFTRTMQSYLESTTKYSFDDSIIMSLDNIEISSGTHIVYRDGVSSGDRDVSGEIVSGGSLIFLMLFPAIGVFLLILGIKMLIKKPSEEDIAKKNAIKSIDPLSQMVECTCEKCGGVYIVGTVNQCPYCSSPINLYNSSMNSGYVNNGYGNNGYVNNSFLNNNYANNNYVNNNYANDNYSNNNYANDNYWDK